VNEVHSVVKPGSAVPIKSVGRSLDDRGPLELPAPRMAAGPTPGSSGRRRRFAPVRRHSRDLIVVVGMRTPEMDIPAARARPSRASGPRVRRTRRRKR
jgi:hypothetical protein